MTDKELISIVDAKVKKLWNEINTGHEYFIIDSYNQFYGICMEIAEMVQKEPVSEDLSDYINELSKQFPEVSFAKLSRIAVRVAKWQKENLWKPADGDNLPEIDKEVVAFQETFPTDVDVPSLLKIVIAHRPNPEGYDGKSIATGKVDHYTSKTYDKGGWNIPDVKFWLDVELPKEIEL